MLFLPRQDRRFLAVLAITKTPQKESWAGINHIVLSRKEANSKPLAFMYGLQQYQRQPGHKPLDNWGMN